MNKLSLIIFLAFVTNINAQDSLQEDIKSKLIDLHLVINNDENFEGFEQIKKEIGDAQIVLLGEQSHTDATSFETKIKLIKYLHQEMGFEILAFESGIYGCDKAWSMIQNGHNVKDAMASAIFGIWACLEELNPLYDYVEHTVKIDSPLIFTGFDPQLFSKLSLDHFNKDLSQYIQTIGDISLYQEGINKLEAYIKTVRKGKKIRSKIAKENIAFIDELIELNKENETSQQSGMWHQIFKSIRVILSDSYLGTVTRDQQMAENLIWLKDNNPDKKIICWGATSHFLYNSSLINFEQKKIQLLAGSHYQKNLMMGDYLKEKYGDMIYTIGFIAHEGTFGKGRTITLDLPAKNSLEYLIGQSKNDNYFLALDDLSIEGYLSRPLGHQNMTTNISEVMDAVVFNRYMRKPYTDWDFLLYLTPENNLSNEKLEKLKQNQQEKKLNEGK